MDGYFVIPAVALALGIWNLMIAILGLFPQFRAAAVGILENTSTRKHVRTSRGWIIPILTRYTYVYTVNGRQYRYSADGRHSKRRLPARTVMVYVKWFPRHAYPDKFSGTKEWAMGIVMLYAGIRILWAVMERIV